ncbi:MAG: methyltransferase family protein [Vicinamibacterales bacterium]
MRLPHNILAALWLIWLLSWVAAAGWSARTQTRQPGADQLQHSVFIWAGAIMLFAHPTLLGPLLQPVYPYRSAIGWSAVALALLGLGWTWWARLRLGALWSAAVTLKQGHTLVRTGPYAITRHPIYTGLFLALVATAAMQDSGAAVLGLLLFLVGLVVKIRQEEQLLTRAFGTRYRDYQARVPALIPGLW